MEFCALNCKNLILILLQKRVSDRFPIPLNEFAIKNAKEELSKSRRKSAIVLPIDKVHNLLKEVLHGHKVDEQVSLYLVAVFQFIASDILKVRQIFRIRKLICSTDDKIP